MNEGFCQPKLWHWLLEPVWKLLDAFNIKPVARPTAHGEQCPGARPPARSIDAFGEDGKAMSPAAAKLRWNIRAGGSEQPERKDRIGQSCRENASRRIAVAGWKECGRWNAWSSRTRHVRPLAPMAPGSGIEQTIQPLGHHGIPAECETGDFEAHTKQFGPIWTPACSNGGPFEWLVSCRWKLPCQSATWTTHAGVSAWPLAPSQSLWAGWPGCGTVELRKFLRLDAGGALLTFGMFPLRRTAGPHSNSCHAIFHATCERSVLADAQVRPLQFLYSDRLTHFPKGPRIEPRTRELVARGGASLHRSVKSCNPARAQMKRRNGCGQLTGNSDARHSVRSIRNNGHPPVHRLGLLPAWSERCAASDSPLCATVQLCRSTHLAECFGSQPGAKATVPPSA